MASTSSRLARGSSVAAGAYGAHGLKVSEEYKTIWRTAVQYHQFAAVSLLATAAVPSARARMVSGAGIVLGAAAFSGSNYAVAFYQDRSLAKLGPYGGMSLIGGWLALTVPCDIQNMCQKYQLAACLIPTAPRFTR